MPTNINIFLILWFFIGFIFGLKITIPMMFDFNRIDDENSEYDYLTFDNILFLIPESSPGHPELPIPSLGKFPDS